MIKENVEIETGVGLSLNYKTYGLAKEEGKSILILHALTGNSNVTGENGWWQEIVGLDKVIDLNLYHIVAIDIPGNGTNGQTVKDIEKYDSNLIGGLIAKTLQNDGYFNIDMAFGVSLGGGLLWEIIVDNPTWINKAFVIAAHWKTSPWLKGITYTQNEILEHSTNPIEDARKMAMLFYRNPEGFEKKFTSNSQAKGWLDYHGYSLQKRFVKEAYQLMNHLLGNINAIEGYKSFSDAVFPVTTELIHIGVNSDILFSADDNKQSHAELLRLGKSSFYEEIDSVHGHDAFLIEKEQLEIIINKHITFKL
jgi:homoserine O-acetyltransferase